MQTKLDKAFKIIVDISNRKVTIPQAISWYVTDENIAHLNCQIIDEVEDSIIDIQSYKLSMRVLTPGKILKEVNYTLSDVTNNIFTITLPDDLITDKGRHQCELSIEYLGDKLTSEPFHYNIIQSIANQLDSTISKDSHYPLVLELEDKLKEWNNILDDQVSKVIILDNDVRNAEKTRQANEQKRIVAENQRQEGYTEFKNEVSEVVDGFSTQLADIENEINTKAKTDTVISNLYNTEGFVNKILDVCQTYTDNFDKIVYGNMYTAWDDTVQTVNGKYELDCSSFINLLIHGVKFHNSRYNGKDDNYGNPLFFNNIDSYKYRLANQIAKYCVENGYAFVPKSLDEIRAGDIVFYSWDDFKTNPSKYTQAQIDFHNNAFMKIDHVAMYLDRKNDSFHHTIQYEQYTPQFLFTVSEGYMNQAVLVARLPFANIQENDTRDIIVNGNVKKVCVNAIAIGTYYLSKKLKKGKLYSLAIDGQVNTDNCYYVVQDEQGNTIYSDYGRQHNFSGTMIVYFLYQGEGTDKIKISIGGSDASITQRNGHINWCSLYEGYKLTISTKQGTSISNIRELQLTDSIKNKFLNGYGYTNNLVEYDTHYLVTLNLSIDEDIVSNFTDIGNFDKLTNSQRIPCLLISNNGVITSGAIQFGYDGIVRVIKYNSTDTWRHAIASGVIVK